jgi:hypothetical protein
MTRSLIVAATLALLAAASGTVLAAAGVPDKPEARPARDLRKNVCANCVAQDDQEALPASRLERGNQRVATKLAAPNVCADPGATAWFVEEDDHLAAFLASQAPHYK